MNLGCKTAETRFQDLKVEQDMNKEFWLIFGLKADKMMVYSKSESELFDPCVMGNILKSSLGFLFGLGCLDGGLITLEVLLGNFLFLISLRSG